VKKRKMKWYGHVTRSKGLLEDNSAGNGAWREEERQTEKEMGGQHPRVDGTKAERHHTSVRGQRETERAGCKVFSGAPTVIWTTG
jgi:hypothetical protein